MATNNPRPKMASPQTDYSGLAAGLEGQIDPPMNNILPRVADRPGLGPATDQAVAIVTAQNVAVRRNMKEIWTELRALAEAAGQKYEYRFPVKNKKTGKTEYITGPTVKLAHDLARVWGNCSIKTRVVEIPTHWIFYSQFIDYEKGFTYERAYQQRKAQDVGMKDTGRAADNIFQIGQSKAERNVIVNALPTPTDYMREFAKSGVLDRVQRNPEGARATILRMLAEMDPSVDPVRVARVFGRPIDKMLAHDLAKLYAEINAVEEGVADPDDLWPTDEVAAEAAAAAVREEEGVVDETPQEKPKPKKAEPKQKKPEQQQEQEEQEPAPKQEEPSPLGEGDYGDESEELQFE